MDANWFLENRGIKAETLAMYGVEFDNGVVKFPYPSGWKYRKHDPDGKRTFWWDKGAVPALWRHKDAQDTPTMFLVEGETDAMRLQQELSLDGTNATVLALSGIDTWQNEYASEFDKAHHVHVILDNDQDYKVKAQIDRVWLNIRQAIGTRATRLYLPKRPTVIKDVCEFFDMGFTVDDLRLISQKAHTQPIHYDALDLTVDPGPIDWLVQDLIARGAVVMVQGESYVGKSWLSMDLSTKLTNGGGSWLGHAVKGGLRVLYVDEENPESVVRQRMALLGFDPAYSSNIRYLHQQGIRLDKHPERLRDEALAFGPDVIFLDSLTRLHTQEENNAGAVASLFNDGINPLARDTGATVFILHHVNKSDSSSSFLRTRGSSDFGASVDIGLDVKRSGGDRINIVHFKNRWVQAGNVMTAQVLEKPAGGVEIATTQTPVF